VEVTYSQPTPVAPEGRSAVSPESLVGEPTVTPRSPLTVEADGHEVALTEPPPPAPLELEAAELELVDPFEDDEPAVELVPQAASAATAISPATSDGRVIRWDMGMEPPFVSIRGESPGEM
jgi:hypothetical protein